MKLQMGKFFVDTRGAEAEGGGFKGVATWRWDEADTTLQRDTVFETVFATAAEAEVHAIAQMKIRADAGAL